LPFVQRSGAYDIKRFNVKMVTPENGEDFKERYEITHDEAAQMSINW
jgi:hypothetical protein